MLTVCLCHGHCSDHCVKHMHMNNLYDSNRGALSGQPIAHLNLHISVSVTMTMDIIPPYH